MWRVLIIPLACAAACGTSTKDWMLPPDLPVAEQVDDFCAAALAETTSSRGVAADLAVAHVDSRLLGPTGDWARADQALVAAMAAPDALTDVEASLQAYAAALPDVCAMAAASEPLGSGSVTMAGEVAVVVPGTAPLALPADARAVVIDLRSLPAGSDTGDAVKRAVGLALATDVSFDSAVRVFTSFPDQVLDTSPVYSASAATVRLTIPATGSRELPLAFVTPMRLGARAATIAGHLRLAGRAWILGHDIHAGVAESYWSNVGPNHGLRWRGAVHRRADSAGSSWPDRIPADIATTAPERIFEQLPDVGTPPGVTTVVAERSQLVPFERLPPLPPPADGLGVRRAMLMTAHGTLDRFYPYFDVVGHRIDEALVDGLARLDALPPDDRVGVYNALGRFMNRIDDGHGRYTDLEDTALPLGYLDIQLERHAGAAVIRSSNHPGILAGDTIVSIDGVDATEWFAEATSRRSAATDHFRFELAARAFKEMDGDRQLTLRDPDGVERTVTATPQPTLTVPGAGVFRSSGTLDDLGAANLLYMNLSSEVTTTWPQIEVLIAQMSAVDGVIVDMRGYPAVDIYELVRYLRRESFTSPIFNIKVWTGAEQSTWKRIVFDLEPQTDAFTGPIVALVSHETVSAAENFLLMLTGASNVTFIGQRSAATNGNITHAQLPGGYTMAFTGMQVLAPDDSTFHGVGIVPDIEVMPTPAQFRDGIDPELAAAIAALQP